MYLKHIRIRDLGPIKEFKLDLPFLKDGNPEPVALVGKNGSGKTIVLAHIADALHQFAANAFQDALPSSGQGFQYYFMLESGTHVRVGQQAGFCYLRFQADQNEPEYIYKTGSMSFPACKNATGDLLTASLGQWDDEGHVKNTSWTDRERIVQEFRGGAHCFFPVHRFEVPHWLNADPFHKEGKFASLRPKYINYLDDPVMVETSAKANQAWLLDVVLDSYVYANQPDWGVVQRQAVNRIIQAILGREDVRFAIGPRTGLNRISIVAQDQQGNFRETVCPSLDHLSAGQAILLNLFLTIIRLADKSGQSIPEQICGLVLIDEVDAHLHLHLQRRTLPELIKLFPNVQFIFTTHSPLLLHGMNKTLEGRFHIVEMPDGRRIDPESFSEFQVAFDALKQTQSFIREVEQEVKQQVSSLTKPVVFVEGKTDEKYLQKAFEVFGKEEFLDRIEIRRIGREDGRGGSGDGEKNLKKAANFLLNHHEMVPQRVLCLFDHDANQPDEENGNVFVRSLQRNDENDIFRKGIENLFHVSLAREIWNQKDKFYQRKEKTGDYGETTISESLKKSETCDYICENKAEPETFRNFEPVVRMIISVLMMDQVNP